MSNLSDRDQKLVFLLLIFIVIFCPYFFVIKDKRVDTENLKAENKQLQERYEMLVEMNNDRDFYIAETEKMNKERDKIVEKFPADIKSENFTQFLLNTEYESLDEEGNWVYPMWFKAATYGTNVMSAISSEDTDTGLVAVVRDSVVSYQVADYPSSKEMLKYLMEFKDPMIYRTITMEFDPVTGNIIGEMTLEQYAIIGNDRELKPVVIDPKVEDAYGRGNEEVGDFGPKSIVLEDEEEPEEPGDDGDKEDNGDEPEED